MINIISSIYDFFINCYFKASASDAIVIDQSNFTNNYAQNEGGAIKFYSSLPIIIGCINYKSNSANYGKDIASFVVRLGMKVFDLSQKVILYDSLTQNHTEFSILNQVPGIRINISLTFYALDHFNQIVQSLNGGYF